MKNEHFILCKDLKIMTNKKPVGQNLFLISRYNKFRFFDDVTDDSYVKGYIRIAIFHDTSLRCILKYYTSDILHKDFVHFPKMYS